MLKHYFKKNTKRY